MAENWDWKSKDGSRGGLLYESGNWGDVLKMLWVKDVLDWKKNFASPVNYFDPFAGDVCYPIGRRLLGRLRMRELDGLQFLADAYLARGLWPSAASGARTVVSGTFEVWDADPQRRENWAGALGEPLPAAESGWQLLARRDGDPDAVWMIDPYDFLAEWRECLPLIAEKSRTTTMLLYLYNRSAKSDAAFKEYRACKNALEDLRGDLPRRFGRVATDSFLPKAHHEMWFLPNERDCAAPEFDALADRLADSAEKVARAVFRCGVCEP